MSGKISDNVGRSSGLVKAAGGGKTVKRHYFDFATRTTATSTAGDQFEFTDAFIPTDPTVNDIFVQYVIPYWGSSSGGQGAGIRFDDGSNQDDYFGRGYAYYYAGGAYQGFIGGNFNVPAGDLAAGTFTITYRTESDGSIPIRYCLNSTDDSRLVTQTRATLMLTEFKN